MELGGVFVETQLVKMFLSKIKKRLLDLAMPRIILNYDGKATLAQAFAMVEKCDRALWQHNAIDMVSSMRDTTKPKKALIATSSLADIQPKKSLHYLTCGEFGHIKGDSNCPQKKISQQIEKSKMKIGVAKTEEKTKTR